MGCAPGGLPTTARVGNERYKIKPPLASSSGFPPAQGAEAGAVPAAGTGVAVTGDGRDAGRHPAPPVALCRCSLAASAVSLPRGVALAPGRHRDGVWRAAGGAGTGLGARIAAPPERHPLLAPAAGSHAGAKTQLGMETLKGSCPGMQRLLLTPNYLLAQTSWPGLFIRSCCADKVMSAPALLGWVAFPLAEQREEAGKAAGRGFGSC